MVKIAIVLLFLVSVVACGGGGGDNASTVETECGDRQQIAQYDYSLSAPERLAWHKDNLYNTVEDTHYLPPELLFANSWDGQHTQTSPSVDYYFGYTSCNRLVGPREWLHPDTNETLSIYEYTSGDNTHYITLTEQGFELVFDGSATYTNHLVIPTGSDWQVGAAQTGTFIKYENGEQAEHQWTIALTERLYTNEGILAWAAFRYSINNVLRHELLLEPKRGITRAYDYYSDDDNILAGTDCGDKALMQQIDYSLSATEQAAWHYNNMYDSATDSYFIPIELWSGGVWDGNKTRSMGVVDTYFGRDFCKHIFGPSIWAHPFTNNSYEVYQRNGRTGDGELKIQYFTQADLGLGRTYDSRNDRYLIDEVKFPAGSGWRLNQAVEIPFTQWRDGSIRNSTRTVVITRILFDEVNRLAAMTYRWYAGEILDHEYTFMPRRAMAYTIKLSED